MTSPVEEALGILREALPAGAAEVERVRAQPPARPTVVVVGETKRGKSSLVNALVNVPGLSPVDVAVATATYLVIGPGQHPAVRAQFPGQSSATPVPPERLAELVTGRGPAPVIPRRVEVDCPAPLLANLTLVDTPGVGGLDSTHGEIALRAAREATALLFVVDASAPFTSHELDFLRQAAGSIELVLFAITKIDVNRGWRAIADADRALLVEHAPRFAGAAILPVSARLFEQAAGQPAPELATVLRTESHIIDLQVALQNAVAARAGALHAANVLRAARTQLAVHYRTLAARHAAVDPDPARAAARRDERDRLVTSRRQESRTWQLTLRAEIARSRMDSMHDVQRETREALHHWRTTIDRAEKDELADLPQQLDAALHATSLRVFDRVLGRLRQITDTVLRGMFGPEELELVYADLARTPAPDAAPALEDRAATVEDKIVLFGGVATGLAASRLIAFLPALIGVGVGAVVVAPVSIGLGLAATAWMVRSRKHLAEKNHLKLWVSETLTEARAALEGEVGNQFIDAEHSLTLALDGALHRRIEALDAEIADIDAALRLDAQEKERRRRELATRQSAVRAVVARIDDVLLPLRSGTAAADVGGVGAGGGTG